MFFYELYRDQKSSAKAEKVSFIFYVDFFFVADVYCTYFLSE